MKLEFFFLYERYNIFTFFNYYCYYYYYPVLLLQKFNHNTNKFEDYITGKSKIKLSKYVNINGLTNNIYFINYCLKNDLIKISDNKICFITSSSTNETLYIILIDIMKSKDISLRYYSYNIFKLNNYKILLDMRGYLYNKFIALAFSYCPKDTCYDDKNCEHYSAFMILSYPNGTDKELDIQNYLFENNEMKINNIIIDL